jgi:hypothetical protein
MTAMLRVLLGVACLTLAAPCAARADVDLDFTQTAWSGPWTSAPPPPITMSLVVTDAAYESGGLRFNQQQFPFTTDTGSGVLALSAIGPSIDDFIGFGGGDFTLDLVFGAGGVQAAGSFVLEQAVGADFEFDASDSGSFETDQPGPCSTTGACQFSGDWTVMRIPEPASAGLLLLAAAGLWLAARRRRAGSER